MNKINLGRSVERSVYYDLEYSVFIYIYESADHHVYDPIRNLVNSIGVINFQQILFLPWNNKGLEV